MNRYFIIIMIVFVFGLTSCNNDKVVPLKNPEPELFETIYESDEYTILKRIDIDEDATYFTIAYNIGKKGNRCRLGEYDKANYRVLYEGKYYDIVEGDKLNLYTCDDLTEFGIISNE